MLEKKFTIGCKQGFHLRPAQALMEVATGFSSSIIVKKDGSDNEADAKSILGLMSLGLDYNQSVTVVVEGDDEADALAAVEKLFLSNFGE
ncbi:HPr family phosphocarrier protein [Ethanoligenens sp.]|uniref:HPr family phosphocarrier protein n=1 Tax=Ethanoligenens sp. TaxID=2099655 RepID=UPI0039EBE43B